MSQVGPLPTFEGHVAESRTSSVNESTEIKVGGAIPSDAYPQATKLATTLFDKYALVAYISTSVKLPNSSGKRLAALLRKEGCPEQDSSYAGYKIGTFWEFPAQYHDANYTLVPPAERGGEYTLNGIDRGWGCTSRTSCLPTWDGRDAKHVRDRERGQR